MPRRRCGADHAWRDRPRRGDDRHALGRQHDPLGRGGLLVTYAARAWCTVAPPLTRGFEGASAQSACRASAAGTAFAVSALNPQAYMDSAVIMGGLAAPLPSEARLVFCAGAILASAIWFFGLGYGASRLSPWLCRAGCSRALDRAAAVSLLALSATLIWREMS